MLWCQVCNVGYNSKELNLNMRVQQSTQLQIFKSGVWIKYFNCKSQFNIQDRNILPVRYVVEYLLKEKN